MYRATIERARTLKAWKLHSYWIHDDEETGCVCDEQPNRFRKGERPLGRCGDRHCPMCYGWLDEKRLGIPTHRQRREDLRYLEQVLDLTQKIET